MKVLALAIEEVNLITRPSIWSKNDVLNLLGELELKVEQEVNAVVAQLRADSTSSPFDMDDFKDKLRDRLERSFNNLNGSDVIDMSCISYDINNGNEIRIDESSIDVNTSELLDAFDTAFDDVSGDFTSDDD